MYIVTILLFYLHSSDFIMFIYILTILSFLFT